MFRFLFATLVLATPAQAHQISAKIADCGCSSACFTDEVQNVGCSGDKLSFRSKGLPDTSHPMMRGMTATNQQMPIPHNLQFSITRTPEVRSRVTQTQAGAVGVAVNGVPIFDPSTQGPKQAGTGKPISAQEAGELDVCGGHAGRGDDYHYHTAPKCLIEELGKEAIEDRRQPIGFANDGHPILALGWFDNAARIEGDLDECRGAYDATGRYFYNVEPTGDYAVLDCFRGEPRGIARDTWDQRKDASGRDIIGIPIKFAVAKFSRAQVGDNTCYTMTGKLRSADALTAPGRASKVANVDGSIFHCSQSCYGHFVEANTGRGPRVIQFERAIEGCPSGLPALAGNTFLTWPQ